MQPSSAPNDPTSWSLRVLEGRAALALLAEAAERARWDALYDACPWATAFQSTAFAECWYGAYADGAEPLVVLAERPDRALAGLMPLATYRASGRVVAVGDWQAEYQGWLALPDTSDAFVSAALAALAGRASSLTFRYVPPRAPLGWATDGGAWAARAHVTMASRGLMRVGPGSTAKQSLKKSGNRSKLKRLAQHGPLTFERIEGRAALEAIMDDVVDYADVRHAAVHDVMPFRADPHKREFTLRMMERPGLLHATALKSGDHVVAVHLGAASREFVSLGVVAHDPRLAAHSPGKMLMLHLAEVLGSAGFDVFDLTPGGDEYKDRFATEHDEVAVVTVHLTARAALRARALGSAGGAVRALLGRAGVSPGEAEARVTRVASRARALGARGVATRVWRRVAGRRTVTVELRLYVYDLARAAAPVVRTTAVDRLPDLLRVREDPERPGGPASFLRGALQRLAAGEHAYTRVEDGVLAHYGWLVMEQRRCHLWEVDTTVWLPPGSAVLYDFYTHPAYRGRGYYAASLRDMLADAAAARARVAYIDVVSDNWASRKTIERAGFEYRGSLFRRVGRGVDERWSTVEASVLAPPPVESAETAAASDDG